MKKNPDLRAPLGQQMPYFMRVKNGKYLTKSGKWIIKTKANRGSLHIPQEMFEQYKHLLNLQ